MNTHYQNVSTHTTRISLRLNSSRALPVVLYSKVTPHQVVQPSCSYVSFCNLLLTYMYTNHLKRGRSCIKTKVNGSSPWHRHKILKSKAVKIKMSSDDGTSPHSHRKQILMDHNSSEWQPITLTFVEYPKGDLLGHFLAWISLIPMAIIVGFIALILFRRDLHTLTFFFGTLVNETLNQVLKYWIREPRPVERAHMFTESGMPSSHSQFIWFFSFYVTLFVLIRLHHMNNNAPLERAVRVLVLITSWTLSFLVCISRIYLRYHTWAQVVVGSLVGIFAGGLWFCLTHFILSPMFPYVVSWKISEFFLLRDTTLIPNILWFEYTVTRQESRARARKLISMKSQ